tara:strand:+ start:2456 stop:2809 length:354 start_codon:yes stop_codon:yes gene_type:complete
MATYTSAQLYGSGSFTEALAGNKTFTFTNHGNNGSTYFTIETVRNSSGAYDHTSPTNALGAYSNFVSMNEDHLVTSPYIASVVLPQGSSSFQFNSTVNVDANSSYLRATGNTTLVIS